MNQNEKDAMIASVENVEAIHEFLTPGGTALPICKTAANAGSVLLKLVSIKQLYELIELGRILLPNYKLRKDGK